MANFPVAVQPLISTSTAYFASTRGPMYSTSVGVYARQRLADDSIGTAELTLTNVADGSRYRVEVASTGALASGTNPSGVVSGSSVTVALDLYPAGNALNSVRIKVRSASGVTKYKPYETQATLSKTAQSVFIAQVED